MDVQRRLPHFIAEVEDRMQERMISLNMFVWETSDKYMSACS